jgi:hypothetical protein
MRRGVAAHVHERAAAEVLLPADVACQRDQYSERPLRPLRHADCSGIEDVTQLPHERVIQRVERLHHDDVGLRRDIRDLLRFGGICGERFFHENVLAGRDRFERPRAVQRGRQRHVDSIDIGRLDQVTVGVEDSGDVVPPGVGPRSRRVARRDGSDRDIRHRTRRRQKGGASDEGGAQHANAKLRHKPSLHYFRSDT